MFGNGTQAVFLYALALRPSQVRSENHPRAMFGCVFDCGYRGADAGVVFDLAVFDGNVEVNADEDALAFEINVLDGKLWHCSVLSRAVLRRIGCGLSNALLRGVSREFVDRPTATEKRSTNPHEIELEIG